MVDMKERNETLLIVYRQHKETVDQAVAGVDVRTATITCPCGRQRAVVKMYQCLYCGVWFCEWCAEAHFGKTRKQHLAELQETGHA